MMMKSVTQFLEKHVMMSMRNIAPEREKELERIFTDRKIEFVIDTENPAIAFSADTRKGIITFGRACLDRLWAIAFAYYRFYREVADQKVKDLSVREVDLRHTKPLRQAGKLLVWAIECDLRTKQGRKLRAWPMCLPRPSTKDEKLSDENCATELLLAATGFILHHELAHIRLGHRPYSEISSADAIRQEKEADFAAADWILGALDDELDPKFQKRALGICLGLLWITSLYIYARPVKSHTHPPAYDRLYQVTERHAHDTGNLPWAFVETVLALHLQNQRIPHEQDRVYESFKECADYFIDVISKMKTR